MDVCVPGLSVMPSFLSEKEQHGLLNWVEGRADSQWSEIKFRGVTAKRRMICFGWEYQTTSRSLTPAPAMPPELVALRTAAGAAMGIATEAAGMEQVILVCYPPGAGIGAHTDAPVFGEYVMGVSLGGAGRLRFTRRRRDAQVLELSSGALYLMEGECRRQWQHALRPVKETRYVITFRALR
ncbi:MAG: alkylated DNA repair protein (DNA oxidative demethylase) [Myxococcota bacterium]|jgi:alkylated DNA repair protein (DNA oxidative demethylase)